MMTSWNENFFTLLAPLWGEPTSHRFVRGIQHSPMDSLHKRPVMRSFDVSFLWSFGIVMILQFFFKILEIVLYTTFISGVWCHSWIKRIWLAFLHNYIKNLPFLLGESPFGKHLAGFWTPPPKESEKTFGWRHMSVKASQIISNSTL